jgi:DNA-binding CsgD family transcriptional regulator
MYMTTRAIGRDLRPESSEACVTADFDAPVETHLEAVEPRADGIESGLLLCDLALHPIGSDAGALSILRQHNGFTTETEPLPPLPSEIRDAIRRGRTADRGSGALLVRIGAHHYRCRFYIVESGHPALSPAVVAVHLNSVTINNDDPVKQIVSIYRLTKREQEALRGIALGLTTKELADRMQVSPNTVKSFVRLITVKMGVSSRAEIMVRLLESSKGR